MQSRGSGIGFSPGGCGFRRTFSTAPKRALGASESAIFRRQRFLLLVKRGQFAGQFGSLQRRRSEVEWAHG
jgi:hypothetical protein